MDELKVGNKKYISSKRASVVSGYTKDYIGQLCRSGKLDSRMVGRSWYIEESAILEHKKHYQGAPVVRSSHTKSSTVFTQETTKEIEERNKRQRDIESQYQLTYVKDHRPLVPTLNRKEGVASIPTIALSKGAVERKQEFAPMRRREISKPFGNARQTSRYSEKRNFTPTASLIKDKPTDAVPDRQPSSPKVMSGTNSIRTLLRGFVVILLLGLFASVFIEHSSTYERVGKGNYRITNTAVSLGGVMSAMDGVRINFRRGKQ